MAEQSNRLKGDRPGGWQMMSYGGRQLALGALRSGGALRPLRVNALARCQRILPADLRSVQGLEHAAFQESGDAPANRSTEPWSALLPGARPPERHRRMLANRCARLIRNRKRRRGSRQQAAATRICGTYGPRLIHHFALRQTTCYSLNDLTGKRCPSTPQHAGK